MNVSRCEGSLLRFPDVAAEFKLGAMAYGEKYVVDAYENDQGSWSATLIDVNSYRLGS